MLKIGLTGGIGSGKSTVAKIFEVLGIPVYYADEEARRIMNEDESLRRQIIKHFGPESYINDRLNRPYISGKVFDNQENLALLNALVHPVTIHDSEQWMQRQKTLYAIKEAALIFESGVQSYLDFVIGVAAPLPLRIDRTMNRGSLTREEVLSRMKNQMDEDKKMSLCDFVINNNEQDAVLPQVIALHNQLVERCGM